MDPNAALATIRETSKFLADRLGHAVITDDDKQAVEVAADRMAQTFQALDDWLTGGGFPPDDWALHRSEEQWRVFCKDCADESSCSEDMGRAIIRAQIEAKTQHRYFLQRRIHAFGQWENVDAS